MNDHLFDFFNTSLSAMNRGYYVLSDMCAETGNGAKKRVVMRRYFFAQF